MYILIAVYRKDMTRLLNRLDELVSAYEQEFTAKNLEIIRTWYSWEKLSDEHEKYYGKKE